MIKKFTKSKLILQVSISTIITALVVVGIVSAATTIGTNISTGGTLSVTGASTLTGNTAVSGTLGVTGATTLNGNSTFGDASTDINLFTGTLQASTTALFTSGLLTYGNSTFGDAATDVNLFTGTLQASTTALFTNGLLTYSNSTFGDAATDVNLFTGTLQASTTALFTSGLTSYGNLTLVNSRIIVPPAYGLDVSSAGTLNIGTSTADAITIGKLGITTDFPGLATVANASSTLANFGGGTTVSGLLFGSCSVNFGTSIGTAVATTTNCTATGVTSSYKVFMTPVGLEQYIVFHNASSTGSNVIQVQVYNSTSTSITTAARTWNWMAIK